MMRLILITLSALLLAGCGETDQSLAADRYQPDTPAYKGVNNAFAEKDWTAGNKASWEKQLRARAQYQNEYLKTN